MICTVPGIKFCCRFFQENDRIDRVYKPVGEFPGLLPGLLFSCPFMAHALILSKKQICAITGCAFSRKEKSDLLYLHVDDGSVVNLHDNIHDDQGIIPCQS